MRVFHPSAARTSVQSIHPSLQRLHEAFCELVQHAPQQEGFEDFERKLHALFVQAERELLGEGLERFDVDLAAGRVTFATTAEQGALGLEPR